MKNTITLEEPLSNNMYRGEASYSSIISPDAYNQIISNEHLYISASDNFLVETIQNKIQGLSNTVEVVELGCGPARILPLVAKLRNINLTGVDCDLEFTDYAKGLTKDLPVKIITADIVKYQHDKPVTIFYSQGVHHHIPKGEMVFRYLTNIYKQLCFGGYYLLSDEFIPNYVNNEERELNLVIWYSHIISHALQDDFQYLAQEETKTLLDDLSEGQPESNFKTIDQINLVLSKVDAINHLAETRNIKDAKRLAGSLIRELRALTQKQPSGNETLDLSRRDYKICDAVFRKEVEKVGFEIESVRSYGPLKHIGAMCVYVLRKN